DVLVPARLHEGDTVAAACLALMGVKGLSIALIHGSSFRSGPESGRTGSRDGRTRNAPAEIFPLSFIRTVTVGVGIAPNSADPAGSSDGRSRAQAIARHHRRWGLPPRPENVRRRDGLSWRPCFYRSSRHAWQSRSERRSDLGRRPSMDLQLKGRTALVTGASMGIGRAIARMRGREGVKSAGVARRKPLLEELAAEIARAQDPAPALIVQDVMAPDAAERIRDQAVAALGSIEILVNSAGGSRPLPVDAGEQRWEEAMTLNFTRVRQLTHAILPGMTE